MPVSLQDVAAKAGVSRGTVSHVLNERRDARISAETQKRVYEAARELGYRPNKIARALVTGRTQTIGVLVRGFSVNTAPMLIGAEEMAREHGYKVQLSFYPDEPGAAVDALRELLTQPVDAILSIAPRSGEVLEISAALPATERFYAVAFHEAGPGTADSVVVDHAQGGYLATRHLLEQGRRKLAYAGGPQERQSSRDRLAGFVRALGEWDLEPEPERIVYNDYSAAGGLLAAEQLLRTRVLPDAIFAGDDMIAAGVIRACRTVGLRVPDDIAVVGFNDFLQVCEACDPPLTSVRMPLREVGRISVERLLKRLEASVGAPTLDWEPTTTVLPCHLVVRQSA